MIEWIATGIVAAIITSAISWWRGKSAGKRQAEQQHQRETLERANTNAQERQRVEDDINRGGGDAAGQLRDRWSRD